MKKNIDDVVKEYLEIYPMLRNNDLMLMARVIKDVYGFTDTFDIALNLKGNVFETVRRSRAKIQETNPHLRADENVIKARQVKEQRIREQMRGL